MKDYMQNFIRRGYRSINGTRQLIEFHIIPLIGHIRVEDLPREDVRQWLQSVLQFRGRVLHYRGGPAIYQYVPPTAEEMRSRMQTGNRVLQVLKAALNYALREGCVECTGSAWREVMPFASARTGRRRFLSEEEQRMFVAACEGDFRRLVMGALYTGARYKELTTLRIENFLGAAIYVPAVVSKTNKPRTIILEKSARAFFAALVADRPREDFIFTLNGHPWHSQDQWRYTRAASTKAELADFSFCVLRHTAASNWLRAGVPIKYIAEQLGHSAEICERHYAHIAPDHRAEIFANLAPSSISGMEDFHLH
jgi:integrase